MVRKIVLSLAMVLLYVGLAAAQNKQITGTVTGPDGKPVAGASVAVDGTSQGTTTDARGEFSLSAPVNGTLIVSFIGYNDEHVAINGKTVLDIKMKESTHGIDDVIVVAFGEAKREAFTGSAAVLKSDDITKTQSSNALNSLNGKVAGVHMTSGSGHPGSAPVIHIRGISSIEANKEPLYIVDGMSFAGGLRDINPSDIESMSVLKDAAATALYGARGANGVILINTKRAKSRDAIINVDIKVGVDQYARRDYDVITSPGQHYEAHYAMLRNYYENDLGNSAYEAHQRAISSLISTGSGGLGYNVYTVPEGQTLIGLNGKLNPNATLGRKVTYQGEDYWLQPDDWAKEIYNQGIRQEYNVSVAAGGDKSNFYASFGYLKDDGVVKKTGLERYTARLKADYQVKKWLKVGANAGYTHYKMPQYYTGIFSAISNIAPIYPLYVRNGDGSIRRDIYGNTVYDFGTSKNNGSNAGLDRPFDPDYNAYALHQLNRDEISYDTASFNGFADLILPAGFKVTFNGGTSVNMSNKLNVGNSLYGGDAASGGSISRNSGLSWSYTLQELITWARQFDKHTVDVMIGHENTYEMARSMTSKKSGIYSNDSSELPQALKLISASSSLSEYNNEGYLFRAQYDYDSRIFVSGSYRRDASSRFHPKHRWGNFWSISAGWLINKESWFNAKWVNELKIKASYGSQGNDGIADFLYMDRYSIANDGHDEWSVRFATKGNENLTWETNTNLNVGVEFGFFGNRLNGSIEYFNRKTTDMLSYFSVPSSMGYSGYWSNVGDMSNQGIEVDLQGVLINKKNFSWDINLNLAYVKNKVCDLSEENKVKEFYTLDGKKYHGYTDGDLLYAIGLPIYTKYSRVFAGVDDATGKPLFYKRADNGDISTTEDYSTATQFVLPDSTSLPDVSGGFGTSFRLYGFDLSVNFVYQIGGMAYDGDYAGFVASPTSSMGIGSAYHKDVLKAWTPENHSSKYPRFQYATKYTGDKQDRFYTDASYLSLQNINFGYTFPAKWMSKIHVSKLRIYLACENVWLWSKRKGFDPRTSYVGSTEGSLGSVSNSDYSPIRTISGGINITF